MSSGLDPFGNPYEQPVTGGLDPVGWFIATTHQILGHDTTARIIGQPPGDRSQCVLCRYEKNPTPQRKQAVIDAIGGPG